MKIKIGFENAKATQDFQVLATVVSSIFGGKKKSSGMPAKDFEEAQMSFDNIFGKK